MFTSITRTGLLAIALAAVSGLASDLSIKVTGPEAVHSVDDFTVTTAITNSGVESITLLNDPGSILTPSWKTNAFGILGPDGKPAGFGGVKVKWSPKLAIANKHYTVIAPGQTIELEHDLSGVYNLTTTGVGAYTIEAKSLFHEITAAGDLRTVSALVEPHSAHFSGKLASTRPVSTPPVANRKRAIGFASCSSSQQTGVTAGANAAQNYVTSTISYLNGISSGTPRFTTWFGTFTAAHLSTIKSHFSLINGDPTSSTYDCSCTEADTYAYVYPSEPGYVYLCGAYWSAPTTGTDSKGGTIVHEQSHFTNNGGTQDYVYGQTAAKSLAKSNSNQAVQNADS